MKIINFCRRYKYILTVAVAYLMFGENNILKTLQLNKKIEDLQNELQYYKAIVENIEKNNENI